MNKYKQRNFIWLPLWISSLFFANLSGVLIGRIGHLEPLFSMLCRAGQCGWWHKRGWSTSGGLNSEPNDTKVPFWVSRYSCILLLQSFNCCMLWTAASIVNSKRRVGWPGVGIVVLRIRSISGRNQSGVPGFLTFWVLNEIFGRFEYSLFVFWYDLIL